MEDIATLSSFWIFDTAGNIKQVKNESDRARAKEIYLRAKEALRYTRHNVDSSLLRRVSCNYLPTQSSTAPGSGPSPSVRRASLSSCRRRSTHDLIFAFLYSSFLRQPYLQAVYHHVSARDAMEWVTVNIEPHFFRHKWTLCRLRKLDPFTILDQKHHKLQHTSSQTKKPLPFGFNG